MPPPSPVSEPSNPARNAPSATKGANASSVTRAKLNCPRMKWSWRLGSVAGIALYVHATFLLLLAYAGWSEYQATHSTGAATVGVILVVAIFACVVLHEFGHALMAKHYGIHTKDITLLPIGGVARLDHIPREPKQELLVALAGPSVNVAI